MKKFLKDTFWSIVAFFGIILALSYLNESYVGMKRALMDPWNWVILALVIGMASLYKWRRRRREEELH